MKEYLEFWKQGFKFSGETTRYDYWYIELINMIIAIAMIDLMFMGMLMCHSLGTMRVVVWTGVVLLILFGIASLIPELAMNVRRLRNAGLPWALIFLKLFNTVFEILMLFPARKAAQRLQRKERFIWLAILGMVVSSIGFALMFTNIPMWQSVIIILFGVLISISDLILNMKRRRIVALIGILFTTVCCLGFLSVKTITHFNRVYETSSSVLSSDRAIYDMLNQESVRDGQPVSTLKIVKKGESVKFRDVDFQILSTKAVEEGYVRIAVNVQNPTKNEVDLYGIEFELANDKNMTRMLQYNSVEAGFALSEYNFRLLNDQEIQPRETIKGSIAFEEKLSDAKYLVIGEDSERQIAIEL